MKEDEAVEGLKAMAHPVRLRILKALVGGERNVGEIDTIAEIGQPSLSQQLAVLRSAGLVQTRREAKQVYYRLDEARIGALGDILGAMLPASAQPSKPARKPALGAARFARLG